MKNILVLFTGGTIGSMTDGDTIDVHSESSYELIRLYETEHRDLAQQARLHTLQPFSMLSENMLPQEWLSLCREIASHQQDKYDGIIITHGTDTLAYTAAAVSYCFADSPIPILLTASNYPLDDPRSEGIRNFDACVSLIVHDPLPGTYLVFENDEGRMLVHLGTRIQQSQLFTDQFVSIYNKPFGEMLDGRLQLYQDPIYPDNDLLRAYHQRQKHPIPANVGDILYLKPYPGFRYSLLRSFDQADDKPQAVLLELYHSGTTGLRSVSAEESLAQFVTACHAAGVDVYAAPAKAIDAKQYASAHMMFELGITPLANISLEAALAKLTLAYGAYDNEADIRRILDMNIFFERVE